MSKLSHADLTSAVRLMLGGIQSYEEKLPSGLDSESLTNLENLLNDTERLNAEQEDFKARLKTSTEKYQKIKEALETEYARAKKLLKVDVPKSTWKTFGIEDKR